MRCRRRLLFALASSTVITSGLALTAVAPARAADIRISPGQDFVDAMRSASPGDTVILAAGNYSGGRWIDVSGREGAPITVRGEGALGSVVIEGGGETLRVGGGASWLVFENLEIRNGGDNLIHIDESSHIVLRDIRAHDAGNNGDVIKVNQASFITLDRVETWGAGRRSGSEIPFQECIDFVDVDDVLVRDSYLHDCGDILMYAKGGSRRVVFERNVFDCGDTSFTQPAVGLGGHTDSNLIDGDFEGYEMVARNNLFVGCSTGALGIYDVRGAWIVHNLFLDVRGPVVQVRAGNGPAGRSEDVHVVNNVIASSSGGLSDVFVASGRSVSGFDAASNVYWNGGSGIPSGGLADPNREAGAVMDDPGVGGCSGDSFADWVARCAPTTMAAVDRGASLAGTLGDTIDDIRGSARPLGDAPDPGPYEGPGDAPPPPPPPPGTPPPPPPGDGGVTPPPTDGGAGTDGGARRSDDGGCSAAQAGSPSSGWWAMLALASLVMLSARRGKSTVRPEQRRGARWRASTSSARTVVRHLSSRSRRRR